MYRVGDIVEIIYQGTIGNGQIVKIEKGFFSTTYYIKSKVTTVWFLNYEETSMRVLKVKEKDIIGKIN